LKCLIVTGIYPPDIGGPATYIPKFALFLKEFGSEVQVISLSQDRNQEIQEGFGKVVKINRNIFKPIRFILVVWAIIKSSKKTDIIFANGLYEETAIANIFRNKKMVFKVVGDPIWERYSNKVNGKENIETYEYSKLNLSLRFQTVLFRWSLRKAKAITCPGENLAKIIKSRYGIQEISVIENGVEDSKKINNDSKEYDIISVSRLVKWKNIDLLIQASSRTKTRLLVIGDGPEETTLRTLNEKLKGDVKFIGSQSHDKVQEFMCKAKIYALISSYEGLSFSLLEALSVGKRMLVSNIEANKKVFGNTKIAEFVDPNNSDEIDSAIRRLLVDSEENLIREKKARELVSNKFSARNQMLKMENLLRRTAYKL
jgi:glycosyltransferase involved in cell wall biosynthesis